MSSNQEKVSLYEGDYISRGNYKPKLTEAVAVIVKNGDRVWFQKRASNQYKPGNWEFVAGSVNKIDENSEQAARRELREELYGDNDYEPEFIDLDSLGYYFKESRNNPQHVDVYIWDTDEEEFPLSEEVEGGEFVPSDSLDTVYSDRELTDITEQTIKNYMLEENELNKHDLSLEDTVKALT